jgi:hypothetical protein
MWRGCLTSRSLWLGMDPDFELSRTLLVADAMHALMFKWLSRYSKCTWVYCLCPIEIQEIPWVSLLHFVEYGIELHPWTPFPLCSHWYSVIFCLTAKSLLWFVRSYHILDVLQWLHSNDTSTTTRALSKLGDSQMAAHDVVFVAL